jgi:hypothetical protein
MTVKGMSKMAYELLKDKHNIAKTTTSSSGDNVACQECKPSKSIKTPRTPRFFVTVHGGGAKQIDVSVCLNENGRLP